MEPRRPGVIFDLDGTLADTLDDLTDSINQVFHQNGLPPVAGERIRTLIGHGLRSLLSRAAGVDDEARLTTLIEAYRRVYPQAMLRRTRLYPGIPDLLDRLTQEGVPMAVLSNKPDEFTQPMCRQLLHRWPLAAIRGATNEPQRKPDPGQALAIAALMQPRPPTVYLVGDSAGDIETARNASIISVAVTWGYRNADELRAAHPDFLIAEPMDLIEVIRAGPSDEKLPATSMLAEKDQP